MEDISLTSYSSKSRKKWPKPGILGSFQLVGTHAGQYELLISNSICVRQKLSRISLLEKIPAQIRWLKSLSFAYLKLTHLESRRGESRVFQMFSLSQFSISNSTQAIWQYNLTSEFWYYFGIFFKFVMPRKSPIGGTVTSRCLGSLLSL